MAWLLLNWPSVSAQGSSRLAHNIEALVGRRQEEERRKSLQERLADTVTLFAGSLLFVYLHASVFAVWIAGSLGLIPGLPPFDAGLQVLAVVAAVEAIFLSTFILISQNGMRVQESRRAELDLQVSLLAEQELTQAIHLLDAIARRLGVNAERVEDIEEAKRALEPAEVLDAIDTVA